MEQKKLLKSLNNRVREVHGILFPQAKDIIQESITIMQNLSVGAAFSASAAMVLLGSALKFDVGFVVIGTIILLLDTFFIFLYIVLIQRKKAKNIITMKEQSLDPLLLVRDIFRKVVDGEITEKEFLEKVKPSIRKENKNQRNIYEAKKINDSYSVNNKDLIFVYILGIGIFFVAMGILSPHIQYIIVLNLILRHFGMNPI